MLELLPVKAFPIIDIESMVIVFLGRDGMSFLVGAVSIYANHLQILMSKTFLL